METKKERGPVTDFVFYSVWEGRGDSSENGQERCKH